MLFDTLDANGDGLITREEMRGALAPQAQAKAQTQARAVSPSVGRCATLLFSIWASTDSGAWFQRPLEFAALGGLGCVADEQVEPR